MNHKQEQLLAINVLRILVVDLKQSYDDHPKYTGYSTNHVATWLMIGSLLGQDVMKKKSAEFEAMRCIEETE